MAESGDHRAILPRAVRKHKVEEAALFAGGLAFEQRLSIEGIGTHGIMTATGKSKTCVWRWQDRFMEADVDGLLSDGTRPAGKAPIVEDRVAELVRLTLPPPAEATHGTLRAMAKAVGMAVSTDQDIWKEHGLAPHLPQRAGARHLPEPGFALCRRGHD